jgi:hypothetical protein
MEAQTTKTVKKDAVDKTEVDAVVDVTTQILFVSWKLRSPPI